MANRTHCKNSLGSRADLNTVNKQIIEIDASEIHASSQRRRYLKSIREAVEQENDNNSQHHEP